MELRGLGVLGLRIWGSGNFRFCAEGRRIGILNWGDSEFSVFSSGVQGWEGGRGLGFVSFLRLDRGDIHVSAQDPHHETLCVCVCATCGLRQLKAWYGTFNRKLSALNPDGPQHPKSRTLNPQRETP